MHGPGAAPWPLLGEQRADPPPRMDELDCLRAEPGSGRSGEIQVPGDKSMSHRALILGALADGQTRISHLLESQDVLATLEAVRGFGARVERWGSEWLVEGAEWKTPESVVDCGNSGTSARLLMGAAAGFPLRARFVGDDSLSKRPMIRLVEPLRKMGALFDGTFFLPIILTGKPLKGIRHRSAISSAQVKTAILLAGLRTSEPVEVIEEVASRDTGEVMLHAFGCDIETIERKGGKTVRLGKHRSLSATHVQIAGDPSSAAFPIVAALVSPNSEVRVNGVIDSPTRDGLFVTLKEMGADLVFENPRSIGGIKVVDIIARSSKLHGVRVPARRAPSMIDEYPALAVAAAYASGETVVVGISERSAKECDRLAAIQAGLAANKVAALATGDMLRVRGVAGRPAGGGHVQARGDHRIAMAFLVMGLGAGEPITVDSAGMIATSFPGFAQRMARLGATITPCKRLSFSVEADWS
jgi:3-phosphoshikimate 1-carboxyvinyltransferase